MSSRTWKVALGAIVMAAIVVPSPARADAPSEYGYWTKAQSPTSPNPSLVPVPPTVPAQPPEQVIPAGGLYVALGPKTTQPDPTAAPNPVEPTAVSALRFYVEPGSPAVLALTVADTYDADGPNQNPHPPYLVDACAVNTDAPQWDAPDGPGRYDDRPAWDCDSTSTPGVVEEDGQRITWDLGTAFESFEGQIDVVLVPKGMQDPQNSTQVQPVPFQLAFSPPDDQTLTVEILDTGEEVVEGEEFTLDSLDLEGLGDFALDGDTFGLGDDLGPLDEGGADEPGRGTRPIRPIARAPIPFDSRGDRILAVALLFMLGTGLWWVGGSPVRPPRLLGSLAGEATAAPSRVTTGGVGRFTRPRTGRPPRL